MMMLLLLLFKIIIIIAKLWIANYHYEKTKLPINKKKPNLIVSYVRFDLLG